MQGRILRRGIVVDTHPEDNSVDLVMSDDGSRLTGVQVLVKSGSTRSGSVDLPMVPPKGDKWDITTETEQEQIAIVGDLGQGAPVVLGFIYPQISQMGLKKEDKQVAFERHQSDVTRRIDGEANIDFQHPSGFSIRIGETPDHHVYPATDFDEKLAIDRNVERRPYLRVTSAGATINMVFSPDGAITLTCDQTIDIHAKQDITVKTDATMTLDAAGEITIKSGDHIQLTAPRIDLN